jgi:hypothetical protein
MSRIRGKNTKPEIAGETGYCVGEVWGSGYGERMFLARHKGCRYALETEINAMFPIPARIKKESMNE